MTKDNDATPDKAKGAAIEPDIQAKLGEKLKEVYAEVVNEPVPDRFTQLLNQLSKSDDTSSDS